MRSTQYYNKNAKSLVEQYDSLDASVVHRAWLRDHLPDSPGLACDIGAGSGRDANWLADKGWDVIAVEPSSEMRDSARKHPRPGVTWLDDSLPGLEKLRRLGHRFDLVLLSAVWMHVPRNGRERAFRILSELLKPSGVLVITLRHGSDPEENAARGFHQISADELLELARRRALAATRLPRTPDPRRSHVEWETVVCTMPDDGTGGLPLLRHVIVNDDKSSSYKLGLLRVLTRIAEGTPGAVLRRTDDHVEIPLGLVGLYWLKQYTRLLLKHDLPQHPNRKQGYGFAREDFYRLRDVSPYDLRVGASVSAELAPVIFGAIRDACRNISAMPVRYITYPGQNRQVFEARPAGIRKKKGPITLSPAFLASFGSLRIPAHLWDTLGHYACWVEPAILREWGGLMQGWGVAEGLNANSGVFQWDDPRRDTGIAADRATALKSEGRRVVCVWSARVPRQPHIDHCFPWARWMNNDLWNLVPAAADVNNSKRDRLPSAAAMASAEHRIKEWWLRAYLDSPLRERFLMEAVYSLPRLIEGEPGVDDMYQAMLHQRTRLKTDQQIAEWTFE